MSRLDPAIGVDGLGLMGDRSPGPSGHRIRANSSSQSSRTEARAKELRRMPSPIAVEHDQVVAAASHLPYLLAAALALTASEAGPVARKIAGGGSRT